MLAGKGHKKNLLRHLQTTTARTLAVLLPPQIIFEFYGNAKKGHRDCVRVCEDETKKHTV